MFDLGKIFDLSKKFALPDPLNRKTTVFLMQLSECALGGTGGITLILVLSCGIQIRVSLISVMQEAIVQKKSLKTYYVHIFN